MGGELGKIIPSFIRRASTDHHHFEGFREFGAAQQSALSNLVQSIPAGDPPKEPSAVELVEHDPHAEARVLAALAFPETELTLAQLREWAAGLPDGARAAIFEGLADLRGNRRHKPPRALEMVFYTFDLLGDFGMYRDMHRHRMLTQSRQLLSTRWGYEMSEELRAAGLAGPFEKMMDRAAVVHESISADYPSEAQYVVPMAYRIRWFMRINLRALMWLVELRSSPQGHPAYRSMAQQMYLRVREVHPHLAAMMRFVNLEDYPLGRLGAEQRQEGKGQ